jgi:hypothetical protein
MFLHKHANGRQAISTELSISKGGGSVMTTSDLQARSFLENVRRQSLFLIGLPHKRY